MMEIKCPKCSWEPDGGKYWMCICGNVWNTFETAACCPKCKKQYKETQCIDYAGGCDKSSPHLDWYIGLNKTIEKLTNFKEEKITLKI